MTLKENILIFSDLDGTALGSDHKFSYELKQLVKEIYNRNFYFIPVTARSTKDVLSIQSIELDLPNLKGIAAANNGTHIYDFKEEKFIFESYIKKEVLQKVFEIFEKNKEIYRIDFMSDDSRYATRLSENSKEWCELMGVHYEVIEKFEDIKEPINHFTVKILEKEPSVELQQKVLDDFKEFENELDVTKYTSRVYDLAEKGINKGHVVERVKEYLDLSDENCTTVAFGDSYNDFALFEAVDVPVAMDNARDSLKEIARFVTVRNDENGVERFIRSFLL